MTFRVPAASLLAFLFVLAPSLAHAQDPVAPPLPASTPLPPSTPPALAPIVVGPYSCFVGDHAGIDDADARTTTDLVCGELGPMNAPAGAYEVRLGKLGTRVLLGLTERASGEGRRVLIQSYDEVPIAARRLVSGLVAKKTVEETQNVDNVVAVESRKPKTKAVATGVYFGLVGMFGAGRNPGASAGADLGLMFRMKNVSLGGHVRVGGIGSSESKLGFAALDFGARYHLDDADTAPFVGGGLGLSYLKASRPMTTVPNGDGYGGVWTRDDNAEGSGFGAYVEAGIELFRASRVGTALSLRADAPFFALKNDAPSYPPYGSRVSSTSTASYVVPISLNLGFSFH